VRNISINHKIISWLLIFLAAALTVRGMIHLQWPQVIPWSLAQSLWVYFLYVAGISIIAALVFLKTKLHSLTIAFTFSLTLVIVAGALWPFLISLWFGVASILLGQWIFSQLGCNNSDENLLLCFIVGAGLFGEAVSILAFFPINYAGLYGVGLALPCLLNHRFARRMGVRLWKTLSQPIANRENSWIEIGLITLGLIYLVVALMPEKGWDPLVMHLYVPVQLLHRHQWGFDASTYAWATEPMLGDWLFAIGYMLAGEAGARLINLTFVFALALLTRELVISAGGSKRAAGLAALILISTPLTFTEGSTLHVEAVLAVFLVTAVSICCRLVWQQLNANFAFPVCGIVIGCALTAKAIALMMIPSLAILLICNYRIWCRPENTKSILLGIFLAFAVGCIPYLSAWHLTGNPVFPFFNKIFQSPLYPLENFHDSRWTKGITWNFIYAITFHSGDYQEARAGTAGFQWILLFAPCFISLFIYRQKKALVLTFVAALFILLVFHSASYLRYIYPAFAILSVVTALAVDQYLKAGDRFHIHRLAILAAVALNLLFLNAGSLYDHFPLMIVFDSTAKQRYIEQAIPERAATMLANRLNTADNPVAFIANPLGADLTAQALYPTWYNKKFQGEIASINSKEDAVNVLRSRLIDILILDSGWVGDHGDQSKQRNLITSVTDEIQHFGNISVRRIDPNYGFRHELLKNSNFSSIDGWSVPTAAQYEPNEQTVVVSGKSPITQIVAVMPRRTYLNIVTARCHDKQTKGRLQINWHDSHGAFIKADGIQFDCSPTWTDYQMKVVAPDKATMAVVYTSGHTEDFLEYKRNSLLQ
jgi:4-amino-4-deoxy-L-arabinose transferase-like glycosyltransferase